MVGLMTTSKAYTKEGLPRLLLPVPHFLWWASADACLHRRLFDLQVFLVQSPVGSLLPSLGSQCTWDFVPSKSEVCFPQSCRSPIIKSYWPSRSDSLGIPSPFVGSAGWQAWRGVQNLHNSGKTSLVLLFSSLKVTHTVGMAFDFIMIAPLPSCCIFLSLDMGYHLWWVPVSSCWWLFNS